MSAIPVAVCGDTVTLLRVPQGTMHRIVNANLAEAVREELKRDLDEIAAKHGLPRYD